MCVLKNLFKCEKKCDTVAKRKALLKDFTSKVYNTEVVYVDKDGKTTDEQYTIKFQLSETQKDKEMIRVQGNASMQNGEDTSIKVPWSGIYLAKKNGYKMRLIGDNIEKDFYVDCDGNETINFLIKKTASEGVRGSDMQQTQSGTGTLISLEKQLSDLINERQKLYNQEYSSNFSSLSNSQQNTIINQVIQLNGKIGVLQLQLLQLNYTTNQTVYPKLSGIARDLCDGTPKRINGKDVRVGVNKYNFCQDPTVKYNPNPNPNPNPNYQPMPTPPPIIINY
jgi:hypothetical protein